MRHDHAATLRTLEETKQSLKTTLKNESALKSDLERQKKIFYEQEANLKMQLQQQLDDMANTAGKQQADARKSFDAERQKLIEEHALSKRTLETRAAALGKYSRIPNKHACTLIIFQTFFQHAWPY